MSSSRKVSMGSADEQILTCQWTHCDNRLGVPLLKVLAAESELTDVRGVRRAQSPHLSGVPGTFRLSILVVLVLFLSHCLRGLLRIYPIRRAMSNVMFIIWGCSHRYVPKLRCCDSKLSRESASS